MPFNLIKKYNELLDILSFDEKDCKESLRGIFNRDIRNNKRFLFRGKPIYPTPKNDGEDSMGNLFNHLTRKKVDKDECHREFDRNRSVRLHWIKYHIEENKKEKMLYFSVNEPRRKIRTYIYDKDEKYVIILEPLRNKTAYYLLTAYPLMGKDAARNKILKKYKTKLDEVY